MEHLSSERQKKSFRAIPRKIPRIIIKISNFRRQVDFDRYDIEKTLTFDRSSNKRGLHRKTAKGEEFNYA